MPDLVAPVYQELLKSPAESQQFTGKVLTGVEYSTLHLRVERPERL